MGIHGAMVGVIGLAVALLPGTRMAMVATRVVAVTTSPPSYPHFSTAVSDYVLRCDEGVQ